MIYSCVNGVELDLASSGKLGSERRSAAFGCLLNNSLKLGVFSS